MKHLKKNSEHMDAITYPLKVVDDISGVTASKVWHRYTDLLVVVVKVDANILLEFLPAPQRSIHRVLVDNPAVEQAVFWDLLMGRNRAELACDSYFRLYLCLIFVFIQHSVALGSGYNVRKGR